MSHQSGEERTIAPTPRRLAEARRRGLFAHSRELTSAAFGCAAVGALWLLGSPLWNSAIALFAGEWAEPVSSIDDVWPSEQIAGPWLRAVGWLAGILGIPVAVAVVVNLLQQGFRLQWRPPTINWSPINPFSGARTLRRGASPAAAGRLIVQLVAVCAVTGLALMRMQPGSDSAGSTGVTGMTGAIGTTLPGSAFLLSSAWLLMAVLDWIRCRRRFQFGLRMTPTEARDEAQELKSRLRPRTRPAPRVSDPRRLLSTESETVRDALAASSAPESRFEQIGT